MWDTHTFYINISRNLYFQEFAYPGKRPPGHVTVVERSDSPQFCSVFAKLISTRLSVILPSTQKGPNVAEAQLRPLRIQGDLKTLPTGSPHFKRFGGGEVLLGPFWWKCVPVK